MLPNDSRVPQMNLLLAALRQVQPMTGEQQNALAQELQDDPARRGYKNPDGSYKPAPQLFLLVNQPYAERSPQPQIDQPQPDAFVQQPAAAWKSAVHRDTRASTILGSDGIIEVHEIETALASDPQASPMQTSIEQTSMVQGG